MRALTFTVNRDELGDEPSIIFTLSRFDDGKIFCALGYPNEQIEGGKAWLSRPLSLPVERAFENACRFAESQGISAIWVDDPDRLFDWEQHR